MTIKLYALFAGITLMAVSTVHAQLTWDADNDQINNGGIGIWDLGTANWDDNGSAPNVVWDNSGVTEAIFGDSGGSNWVSIADGGVTVGDITLSVGTEKVQFKSVTDNLGVITIKSGGATWDTGGREIEFLNDTLNDTKLDLAGNTLTINGGGVFDGGEKGNNADWGAGNLIFTEATEVRSAAFSIGKLTSVELAAGSTFINERNSNQVFDNAFVLNGDTTFGNRWSRQSYINGVVSGAGRLVYADGGNTASFLRLNNTANTFSGGVMSDGILSPTSIQLNGTDGVLGAVPASFDPDNILLKNGGMIEIVNMASTMNANRGITLDGGGVIIPAKAMTLSSPITGTGDLTIGDVGRGANVLTLTAVSDYTGNTIITKGTVALAGDDLLPTNTVVSVGGTGGGSSWLSLNGFDQTVGGIKSLGTNTKGILNNGGGSDSTLTISLASGSQTYGGNFSGSNQVHLVKEGAGTQYFSRTASLTTAPASITINEGRLTWDSSDPALGPVAVNSGGGLGGLGTINAVTFSSGSSLHPGSSSDWVAPIYFSGDVDFSSIAADNAGAFDITFSTTPIENDQIMAMDGIITIAGLGMSDFSFSDKYGIESGIYTVMVANVVSGSLDLTDLTGGVGAKGATGTLSVSGSAVILTIVAGDYSAFHQWANNYGLIGSDADADFDYDSDGYNNLQEYAFGGDPTNSAVIGNVPVHEIIVDESTNWLIYAYGYRTTDTNLTVECKTTTDLIFGSWITNGITVFGTGTLDGDFDTITNGIPMDGVGDFLGVFVEQQ